MHVREDSLLTAKRKGSRSWLVLTVATLLILTLAACGGGSGDGETEKSTEAEKPKEPVTTANTEPVKATKQALNATINGTIRFGAEARRVPAVLNMEADPVCAEKNAANPITEQAFLLDESKGLANVLIQVKAGLPDMEFPAPESEVVFSQEGCNYDPHILIVRVGQKVRILNPDGTLHNVHVFGKVNQEFNQAMPKFQTEIEQVFEKVETEPFAIKCDVHPWMNSFGVVLDHPYAAVTGSDGSFSIPNLPSGTYQVEVWHELLGSQTHEVTVEEGKIATLDLALQPPS